MTTSGPTTLDSTMSIGVITSGIAALLSIEDSSVKNVAVRVGIQTQYWMMALAHGSHVVSVKGQGMSLLICEGGGFDGKGCWRWRG